MYLSCGVGRVGFVVFVSFCGSFEIRVGRACVSPSWVSSGTVPVGIIVPISTRSIFQPRSQSEAVLDECNAKTSPTSVLGSVGCVQQEGQQKADELEGYRDEHIPQEGEEGSCREALEDHFARG